MCGGRLRRVLAFEASPCALLLVTVVGLFRSLCGSLAPQAVPEQVRPLSGFPEAHAGRHVRIFRPTKTAVQSGINATRKWSGSVLPAYMRRLAGSYSVRALSPGS